MPRAGRLRELREAAYLSQQELAEKSGVARPTITRLEQGKQEARYATIRRLADALGVTPRDLMEPASQR